MDTTRINISIPVEFYNELVSKLPVRRRSQFIVSAVKDKLKKLPVQENRTYAQKIKKFAAVISAKDHPEWKDSDSIIDWVNKNRSQSIPRV